MSLTTEDRRKNPVGFSPLDRRSECPEHRRRAGLNLRALSVLRGSSLSSSNPITRLPDDPITRFSSLALRHFVAATAVLALVAYVALYGRLGGAEPIKSDGYSYYVYLPSWFI
jgi:hypothetical protein